MNIKRIIKEEINNYIKHNSRGYLPKVRKPGWTQNKILKILKKYGSFSGMEKAIEFISEFDNVQEFASHLFWHGSSNRQDSLKPSIALPSDYIEKYGGGGRAQQYWGISLTKDKYIATLFTTDYSVYIHPIVLAKDANIKEMPDFEDAYNAKDYIEQFWNEGIDGVWIGDKDDGEQELLILNPQCICNISNMVKVFKKCGLKRENVPNPSTDTLQMVLDACKAYMNGNNENSDIYGYFKKL